MSANYSIRYLAIYGKRRSEQGEVLEILIALWSLSTDKTMIALHSDAQQTPLNQAGLAV
jgi:hypothetical protein